MSNADESIRRDGTTRRTLLRGGAVAGFAAIGGILPDGLASADDKPAYRAHKERINQSVVKWCFRSLDVPTLARHSAAMGIKSVELVPPKHWPVLRKLGLRCAISSLRSAVRA